MTEIKTPIPSRIYNAAIDGHVAGAEDIFDDDLNLNQAQINAIFLSESANISLAVNPTVIFVDNQAIINLTADTNKEATSIKIKRNNIEVANGSGMSLSGSDTITPSAAGNITYNAEFTIAGLQKSTTKSVAAVYPIRIGSGTSYVDGTAINTPKISPAGTYSVVVANDGDYVYFNVPSTMTIHGATMSGFDFPLEPPTEVTIDGVAYESYRSSNTYDAGTLTIIIF